MITCKRPPFARLCRAGLAGLALATCLQAGAQYKVVGPDGKVTYTDRPAANLPAGGQVQTLRSAQAANPNGNADIAGLPLEIRQVAARFPVTLYTSGECPPCDSGRKLLQQRGVPFRERVVTSDDDVAALLQLSGGKTVPALTVGSQALKGYQATEWGSTLDLAGYPSESKLPRNYVAPQPVPLVSRNQPVAVSPEVTTSEPSTAPSLPQPGVGKIRF